MWYLRTLGQLSLHPEGPGSNPVLGNAKPLGVVAYLATLPGRAASRRHIAELFWPGVDRGRGRRSLRQALYYLSKRTGDELVRTDADQLALPAEGLDVDVWRLDAALEDDRWEDAVALYDGPFLAGFEGKAGRELEGWIEAENDRVWSGLRAAYYALVAEARSQGRPERAARYARAYVQLNPLDESAQTALVRSLKEAGKDVAAYQAYERYRTLLREELGVEPGEEIEARLGGLRRQILEVPAEGTADAGGASAGAQEASVGAAGSPSGEGADAAARPAAGPSGRPSARPSPTSPSGPATERPPAGRRSIPTDRTLWIAAAALLVAAVALVGRRVPPSDAGVRTAWDAVEADLLAGRATGGDRQWHVRIEGGRVSVDPSDWSVDRWPAPGGGRVAAVRRGRSSGPDVVVAERGGRETAVTTSRWEEVPLAWSPDGRRLVFRRGFPAEGRGTLRNAAYVYSLETSDVRRLVDAEIAGRRPVAWSPAGVHVAVAAHVEDGGTDLFRVDADGRRRIRLTADPARDEEPAWSPDGERLAFVSWRTGRPHLWTLDVDGSGLEQVTFGGTRERDPVWVSDHHLVFRSDRAGGWDLWSLDLVTRRTRRLTRLGDFSVGRLWRWHREPPEHLIERVEIRPRPRRVSPGLHLYLEARPSSRRGHPVPVGARSVRWVESDRTVLVRDSAWFRVVGTGPARVVADVAGWRADTLDVLSVPPRVRSGLRTLLEEPWTGGLSEEGWFVVGTPRPYVTRPNGPGSGASEVTGAVPDRAFVGAGDENYGSGVVSRRILSLERGVTIVFPASLPLERGAPHQSLQVRLVTRAPGPETRATGLRGGGLLQLSVTARPPVVRIHGRGSRVELPWPDDLAGWHEYAVQVAPDGTTSLVRDGRFHWMSGAGFVETAHDARLSLGGRSLGTELLVGPMTVFEGRRYVLADTEAR